MMELGDPLNEYEQKDDFVLFRNEDKGETKLELWEHERHEDKERWALCLSTDYRTKQGEQKRVVIQDEKAGWLIRKFVGISETVGADE